MKVKFWNFLDFNETEKHNQLKKFCETIELVRDGEHSNNLTSYGYVKDRDKVKKLIEENILASGVDPKILPINLLDPKFKEVIVSKIPSARLGDPEDIANAVLFLASKQSNYINGTSSDDRFTYLDIFTPEFSIGIST